MVTVLQIYFKNLLGQNGFVSYKKNVFNIGSAVKQVIK